ncbi:hypothetical protein ACLOJK_001241 [Asimina triloba]
MPKYGENAEETAALEVWKCPKCRGICNCSICMKKRGHQPTGILVQTARAIGFSSVSEMLQVKGTAGVSINKNANKAPPSSPRKHGKENSSVDPNVQCNPSLDDDEGKLKDPISRNNPTTDNVKRNATTISDMSDGLKKKNGEAAKGGVTTLLQTKKKLKSNKYTERNHSENLRPDTVLPERQDLLTVGGAELSANDIGPALQFLEFCGAFQQVLDLKKGQPEAVLRELTRGRIGRSGVYSSIVQFHIKLLSILQEDLREEATDWYNKLESSEKLHLLNFLCDETLGTDLLRNWIDKEHSKTVEAKKEAKAKVIAAKEKEKLVKTKFKAEMVEALTLSNGALSVGKHENLISKMRTETEKARAEKLEAMAKEPKSTISSFSNFFQLLHKKHAFQNPVTAIAKGETEPILLDGDGQVHWRLRGYSDRSCLVLQDIGKWDSVTPQDKWFAYDDDKQKTVETYVSLRKKRKREEAHATNSPKLVRRLHSEVAA